MERANWYLLSLSFLLLVTAASLLSVNESHVNVYIGFFAVEYFICALIYRPEGQYYRLISATLIVVWAITAGLSVAGLGF